MAAQKLRQSMSSVLGSRGCRFPNSWPLRNAGKAAYQVRAHTHGARGRRGRANLFSSDLDCDRLDYLMRTAHCTGLPYGRVDVEYLTTQVCIDSDGHLCLAKKALRAADHLLMSRYFDYAQVVFHKTVVALEDVLCDVITDLLQRGFLDCSGATMRRMILGGSFADFDDHFMIGRMRAALPDIGTHDPLHRKINSVLNRRPPKLVASHESIGPTDEAVQKSHRNHTAQLKDVKNRAAKKFGIPLDLWHVWQRSLGLTKIGSRVPLSDVATASFEEDVEQSVRILTTEPDDPQSKSKLLVEHDFALISQLSQSRFYAIRVYVHLSDEGLSQRADIERFFKQELPNFPFSP